MCRLGAIHRAKYMTSQVFRSVDIPENNPQTCRNVNRQNCNRQSDEAIAVVRHHGLQSYLTAATNPNPDRHVEKVGTHLVVTGSRAATPNRPGATWPSWRGSFVVDRGSGRAVP